MVGTLQRQGGTRCRSSSCRFPAELTEAFTSKCYTDSRLDSIRMEMSRDCLKQSAVSFRMGNWRTYWY